MAEVCARGNERGEGELGRCRRTMERMVWLKSILPSLG